MRMNEDLLARIVVDPAVMVGKPVIKGTRIPVALILRLLGQGVTAEEILEDCDWIDMDDIRACLLFANKVLEDVTYMPLVAEGPTLESAGAVPHR